MTTKKKKKEKELQNLEKEILETKQQLEVLERKFKNLQEIKMDINIKLVDVLDFTKFSWGHYLKTRTLSNWTVWTLINSSHEELIKVTGIGPATAKLLEEWMDENDLKFL